MQDQFSKMKEIYASVCTFNTAMTGNTKITQQHLLNQLKRVYEELDESVGAKDTIALLDGYCDVIVTMMGLIQKAGLDIDVLNTCGENYKELFKEAFPDIKELLVDARDVLVLEIKKHILNDDLNSFHLLPLAYTTFMWREHLNVIVKDVDGALAHVCENNMTKFVDNKELAHKSVLGYSAEGVGCEVKVTQVGDKKMYAVIRTEDGKLLKPFGYEPVDLTQFI